MTGCSGKAKWGKAIYSKQLLILSCGPIKQVFKKDLKGNMEQSFSLDGETHQYRQNSVASQGRRTESSGKPWGMRGFRLHPQTQTGWALLPVTQRQFWACYPHKQPDMKVGKYKHYALNFDQRKWFIPVWSTSGDIFFVQDTIFEPSLQSGAFIPYLQVGITRCGPLQS